MIKLRDYGPQVRLFMRKWMILLCLALLLGCLAGCGDAPAAQVAATTLPVYEFTSRLCQGTGITVARLVTEQVSCLHDYSLNVRQVKAAEAAECIVISGAGLEDFMADILEKDKTIDASAGIELLVPQEHHHEGEEAHHEGHSHEKDPHIWLDPELAVAMARNICRGLESSYPDQKDRFRENLTALEAELEALAQYGREQLKDLKCREIITFHDGFSYFANAFGLHIVRAVEEESGSEASAKELIHLIEEVRFHNLPAIFTEKSGSVSAAGVIARETGCGCYQLDMAMSGESWFEAMYHNIDTIKEALG